MFASDGLTLLCSVRKHEHSKEDVNDVLPVPHSCAFAEATSLQTFGIAASQVDIGLTEPGCLGCLRLAAKGLRIVAMLSIPHVQQYLSKGGKHTITFDEAVEWARASTQEQLEGLVTSSSDRRRCLQVCTVGPWDLLWTPVGWCYFVKVMHSSDVIGLRQAVLSLRSLTTLEDLHEPGQESECGP